MCYDTNARPPVPPGDAGRARGEDIVLTAADGTRFAAYAAYPGAAATNSFGDAGGARIVIYPDMRGLHQFYKDLAVRFAEQGIVALAIDYFGRSAGLSARDDAFEFMPHVQQMRFDAFQSDVDAALAYLRRDGGAKSAIFTMGFCMGGALSLLTGARDLGLAGVIGFYAALSRDIGGGGTVLDRAMAIKYPTLALFGGADSFIPPEQVETLDQELDKARVEHEVITYPGAPHSFFDRSAADHAEASADAWTRILRFIRAHSAEESMAAAR